jgi:DNA-binding FadR family transcriptional regulator
MCACYGFLHQLFLSFVLTLSHTTTNTMMLTTFSLFCTDAHKRLRWTKASDSSREVADSNKHSESIVDAVAADISEPAAKKMRLDDSVSSVEHISSLSYTTIVRRRRK